MTLCKNCAKGTDLYRVRKMGGVQTCQFCRRRWYNCGWYVTRFEDRESKQAERREET